MKIRKKLPDNVWTLELELFFGHLFLLRSAALCMERHSDGGDRVLLANNRHYAYKTSFLFWLINYGTETYKYLYSGTLQGNSQIGF